MEFGTFVITNKGQALMAKLMLGAGKMNFTAIRTSETAYAQDDIQALTALSNIKQTAAIGDVAMVNDVAIRIRGAIDNSTLVTGYDIQTIGVYATDPDEGEILYAVARALTSGYMPPNNGVTSSGANFDFILTVASASTVNLQIDPAGVATLTDVLLLENEITNLKGFVGYTEDDVYGVEVDLENKTFTRLAGSVGRNEGSGFDDIPAFGGRYRCNLTDAGIEVAKYGDAGYSETGKLTQAITIDTTTYPVGTNVQVMVKQPKFYYRVVPLKSDRIVGGKGQHLRKARYYISMTPKTGFKLHPAFIQNGQEKGYVYLSAYEGSLFDQSAGAYILNDAQIGDFAATSGDRLASIANAKPISGLTQNLTRRNCGIIAENRGAGWYQMYGALAACSQLLFLIEYNSFDVQRKIGDGVIQKPSGTGNESEITGTTTNLGNASGKVVNTNGYSCVSYRGEENLWANIFKWVDGINVYPYNLNELYIADHAFTESKNDGHYKNAGITVAKTNGYTSAFAYNEDFDWLFFPSEVLGDSALPVGDYHYQNAAHANGFFTALLGGGWDSGAGAGLFYWSLGGAPSGRGRSVGGRLAYVPPGLV